MHYKKSIMATALLMAFGATSVQADEDLFFTEMPIVASVSRLPQKLSEAPASVTVIDREMIRASGFRTVEDLMRLVPGFQVSSHNQDSALVAYHGLTGGMNNQEYTPRVQVLVDGRSQYSPLFKSGVHWNLIPVVLENIERIEVIRGSNTVAYGSNAALGVINIITQDPSQTKGWMVAANRGKNFIRDETLRWGGKVGEADVRFTVHQLGDNGFQWGKYENTWVDSPDDRRSRVIDLKAVLPLGNRDELQLNFSEVSDQSMFGRPFNKFFTPSTSSPLWYANTSSTALGLEWRRIIDSDEEIKFRYNLTRDRSWGAYLAANDINATFTLTDGQNARVNTYYDSAGSSLTHEFEFDHIFSMSENKRLMWGASAKHYSVSSISQFWDTAWRQRSTYRVFSNLEHRPSKQWTFNYGASLERDSLSGVNFDPRFSANFHFAPEQTLRFVASRAHRTPSLYENQGRGERYGQIGGVGQVYTDISYLGQGVSPEKIDTLELGYFGELKEARASADVRVFWEHIPNMIQIVPMPLPVWMPDQHDNARTNSPNVVYPYGRADGATNMENVHITGYEYQLRWQPFEQTRILYNNALVSIQSVANLSRVADDSSNTEHIVRQSSQSSPSRSQTAMLIQKLPYDVTASVIYFRAGPMRWRRKAPQLAEASERFDWRLAKSFKLGGSKVEVAYTAQMVNESQQGRQTDQRYIDKLHWLSLRLDF